MKVYKKITVSLSIVSAMLVGCGGGSSSNSLTTPKDRLTGHFIDAPVEGIEYESSSGIKGVTDKDGSFYYKRGEKVRFHIGKLTLGEAVPNKDGLITPKVLTNKKESEVLMLQTLQALDSDHNPENGITIPKSVINSLKDISRGVDLSQLVDEDSLLHIDQDIEKGFTTWIDHDNDGHIDIAQKEAKEHFDRHFKKWREDHEKEHLNHHKKDLDDVEKEYLDKDKNWHEKEDIEDHSKGDIFKDKEKHEKEITDHIDKHLDKDTAHEHAAKHTQDQINKHFNPKIPNF